MTVLLCVTDRYNIFKSNTLQCVYASKCERFFSLKILYFKIIMEGEDNHVILKFLVILRGPTIIFPLK